MCGLAGFWSPTRPGSLSQQATRMANAITARGPDDFGVWVNDGIGLALSHRRLSVIELSPAGHQPMVSSCQRYVIVFNGEIYNHLELRRELEKSDASFPWRGQSDTETLLHCFAAWGIERTLQATVGMFALALWDCSNQVLTLARDRLGEKPLYWGWQDDTLLFGSELKALRAHPSFKAEVDRNALALFLRHSYIAAPYSIYQHIQKLRPGHFINIPLASMAAAQSAGSAAYWEMNDVIHSGLQQPFEGSQEQTIDALEEQLSQSVGTQMQADVSLGAFLSSGIDSSSIVALMQAQSHRPIRTFTIGFTDEAHNEAVHAKAIAKHLGTEHTELYLSPEDTLAVIPHLPEIYDEPFADSSQIPTFLVSRLARQHVTVALSGDAGDELFGGYNTYRFVPTAWRRINRIPAPLRRTGAVGLSALSTTGWDTALNLLRPFLPAKFKHAMTGEKIHKLAALLPSPDKETFYQHLSSHWKDPENIVVGAKEPATLLNTPGAWPQVDSMEHWMMALNAQTYMTDDILAKVDRAAMANSLEVRVPMLDHRVIELAWRIPLGLKIRDGKGKWILREVLHRYVPRDLMERPKKGFSIPLADWLRGPLRNWAEGLLDSTRLLEEGYFNPRPIQQAWELHLSEKYDYSTKLWCILMFQAWLEQEKARR